MAIQTENTSGLLGENLPDVVVGAHVEVLSNSNRLIFVGKVTRVEKDQLWIANETGRRTPYVEDNTEVKVRGTIKDGEAYTIEGTAIGSTREAWRITGLRALRVGGKRNHFRQNIRVDAQAICANEMFGQLDTTGLGSTPFRCQIVDLSAGGAMLTCMERLSVGDWLLFLEVQLLPNETPFTFTCIIRRVKKLDNGEGYEYGCQFHDLETKEQDRLVRSILALQRMAIQSRRRK